MPYFIRCPNECTLGPQSPGSILKDVDLHATEIILPILHFVFSSIKATFGSSLNIMYIFSQTVMGLLVMNHFYCT